MFRNRTNCNECHEAFDALEDSCPNCGHRNETFDELKMSRNTITLPWAKQLAFFLIGCLGFQIIAVIVEVIMLLAGYSVDDLSTAGGLGILNFAAYLILFAIFLILLIPYYKTKVFRTFKGYKVYIYGIGFGIGLIVFSIVYGLITSLIYPIEDNANQSTIEAIAAVYPFLSVVIFGIVGPICEELTYRVGLFTLLRRWNRVGAYIVTMVIFAFIHFDFTAITTCISTGESEALINELLNIPSYLVAAWALTYVYDKHGFAASTTAHAFNNLVSVLLVVFGL